jgi:hypothetical protein
VPKGALVSVISASAPNDGTQRWRVPADLPVGRGYKVQISSTGDPSVADTSDRAFRIRE